MIRSNANRYSVSAQCACLGVARATYYRNRSGEAKPDRDAVLKEMVGEAFAANRCVFGSRKIRHAIRKKHGLAFSLRRVRRCMAALGIESAYTKKKHRRPNETPNNADAPNLLARAFDGREPYEAVVSDLTYVRVRGRWHYVCLLLDLHGREIIGHGAGAKRDAALVGRSFAKVKTNLSRIQMFHSDRGGEFGNALVDEILETFGIARSLSMKACPYDNAVAESTFRMFKAEFAHRTAFDSLPHLERELDEYVEWFNNERPHSTLGYMAPAEYRRAMASERANP